MKIRDKGQERLFKKMRQALRSGDRKIINALPGLGKTHVVAKLIPDIDIPVTYVTERRELYDQFIGMLDDGVSYKKLPSFPHDCEVMNGQISYSKRDHVEELYEKGVTAREIHGEMDLPCNQSGKCQYIQKWDFDPDQYEVLVGHYKHLYRHRKVVYTDEKARKLANERRAVIIDEFPGSAFEFQIHSPQDINDFLSEVDLPQENVTELIESRGDQDRQVETVNYLFDGWGDVVFPNTSRISVERDPEVILEGSSGTPYGEYAVATIVFGDEINQFLRYETEDRITLFDKEKEGLSMLKPPNLSQAQSVIALDGTPTVEMWNTCLDICFEEYQVLDDSDRLEHLEEEGIQFCQTIDAEKPYSSGKHVNPDVDFECIEAVCEEYKNQGVQPVLISTKKALDKFEQEGLLDEFEDEDLAYYGDLKGSNDFSDRQVAIIIGSPHYGNKYIRKWAAYANQEAESNGEKGMDKSYGPYGDKILKHMRENNVFQAAMRVGRGNVGANVFFHTSAFPRWLEVKDIIDEIQPDPNSTQAIRVAIEEELDGKFSVSDIVDEVECCERMVQQRVNELCGDFIEEAGKDGRATLYQQK